jgi:hypothetical protein
LNKSNLERFLIIAVLMAGINLHARQAKPNVGDIAFDTKNDDPKFQFCNPNFVLQGYELKTSSDESRAWISEQLKQKFTYDPSWKGQSGFITVRFAVNCFGLTDRFRSIGVNSNLMAVEFPSAMTKHLIKLVKEIKWPVQNHRLQAVDYYEDVTFKIINGELKEALL